MPDEDRFRVPLDGDLIDTLASDTRREVLQLLEDRRMTLSELARELDLQKSTVLEHLRRLDDEGLVDRDEEEDRLWVYYELTSRGRSILSPQRSQLYLVLGGAVAVALIGVMLFVVGQGLMTGPAAPTVPDVTFEIGGDPTPDATEASEVPEAADSLVEDGAAEGLPVAPDRTVDVTRSDVTWWRQLDGPLTVRLGPSASSGTLAVVQDNGSRPEFTASIVDRRARLEASSLDQLDNATYHLRYRADDTMQWTTLDAELTVASARIHVLPARLVADTPSAVRVAATPPEALDRTPVRIDGSPLEPDGRLGSSWVFNVQTDEPGSLTVKVGRKDARSVPVAPHWATQMHLDAHNMSLKVRSADGEPVEEIAVHVDGEAVGFTDDGGQLAFERPPDGAHRVNLSTEDGRRIGWVVAADGDRLRRVGGLAVATRAIQYGAEDTVFDVVATNDAPAPRSVGVVARSDDRISAAGRVEIPASGHSALQIAVPTAAEPVDVRVRLAAKPPLELDGEPVGPVVARSRFDASNPVRIDEVSATPRVDDRIRVGIQLSNPAPVPASRPLSITLEGGPTRTVIVDLDPGASTTETVYLDDAGQAAAVTVEDRTVRLAGTSDADTADKPAVPGPGLLAAAGALVVVALRLRRR